VFSNFLIGLREGLEAALVVSILVAYLVKTERRDRLPAVWLGVGIALTVSLGFGALLTYGSSSMTFEGQEAFGGFMSIIAVGFVTWMIFWMRRTARTMKQELHGRIESALDMGAIGLTAMAALAVGREGLETALFLWSNAQATGQSAEPLIGAVLGLVGAVVIGYLLYRRAIAIDLARFFTITGGLLIVVAAGVLAYGLHDLQEAGILPGIDNVAYDITSWYSASSWYGTLLKGFFNFSPSPTVLEVVAWFAYLVPVGALFLVLGLTGCTSKATNGQRVEVAASDSSCGVSTAAFAAGPTTFAITNTGNDVTEVYVYGEDDRVMGEVENVGAGTSRSFTIELGGGSYEVACKPGQTGDGIRTSIVVTGPAETVPVPDRTVELTSYEYGYSGIDFFVGKMGETVRFTMLNKGTVDHEMEVLDGEGDAIGEIGPTAPGATGDVVITFAEAGDWTVRCGIEGHLEHGMRRSFTVVG
jgi:high-affinity iron transporter